MQGRYVDHRRWRSVGLVTVLACLPVAAWAHTVGVEGDAALARGLNMSVLFLLCMPLAIVGVLFGTVYVMQKRAQRQARQEPTWTPQTPAHRHPYRRVLRVLAALFFD